jgi:predicted flap endonuclease-1-like 5' DNA nuclease
MGSALDAALEALAKSSLLLESELSKSEDYRALRQLQAREAKGEPVEGVCPQALRASLHESLASWPLYGARQAIEQAMGLMDGGKAVLEETVEALQATQQVARGAGADPVANESPPPGAGPAAAEPEPESQLAAPATDIPPAGPHASAPPDDLTRIRRIDRPLAERLAALGCTRFVEIAAWRSADVARIAQALDLGRRISRESWIEQAAQLAMRQADAGRADEPPPSPPLPVSPPIAEPPPRMAEAHRPTPAAEVAAESTAARAARHAAAIAAAGVERLSARPSRPTRRQLDLVEAVRGLAEAAAARAVAAARIAAEAARRERIAAAARAAAEAKPDELTLIAGIDRPLAAKLAAAGATKFKHVAAWMHADIERMAALLDLPPARIARENWIEQAALLGTGAVSRHSRMAATGALARLAPMPPPEPPRVAVEPVRPRLRLPLPPAPRLPIELALPSMPEPSFVRALDHEPSVAPSPAPAVAIAELSIAAPPSAADPIVPALPQPPAAPALAAEEPVLATLAARLEQSRRAEHEPEIVAVVAPAPVPVPQTIEIAGPVGADVAASGENVADAVTAEEEATIEVIVRAAAAAEPSPASPGPRVVYRPPSDDDDPDAVTIDPERPIAEEATVEVIRRNTSPEIRHVTAARPIIPPSTTPVRRALFGDLDEAPAGRVADVTWVPRSEAERGTAVRRLLRVLKGEPR